MSEQTTKAYLDKYDIMKRYDCGVSKAISIIRCIHHVCGGEGALGKGKVLPSELEYWEACRGTSPTPPKPEPAPSPPKPEPPPQYIYRSVSSASPIVYGKDGKPNYIRKQMTKNSSIMVPIKKNKEQRK